VFRDQLLKIDSQLLEKLNDVCSSLLIGKEDMVA
jgi:hypothetical protein